jgi:hypothetical protein
MADDWWTGSRDAGLKRSIEMGGPLPPGSLPAELMNQYSGAQDRGAVVADWQAQAQARADQAEALAQQDWRSQMERGLAELLQRKKRKRGLTAQDAGDALAGSSLT